jgi:hypothetical protein
MILPKLVLISGLAGSGKTTLANFMRTQLSSERVAVLSFADPIKVAANRVYHWDGKKDKKGRELLQDIGSIGRKYDKNIWVKKLNNLIYDWGEYIIIVDDWRYLNEASWFVENGYEVIKLRVIGRRSSEDAEIFTHISELELEKIFHSNEAMDYFHWAVVNDTSLDSLHWIAHTINKMWLGEQSAYKRRT